MVHSLTPRTTVRSFAFSCLEDGADTGSLACSAKLNFETSESVTVAPTFDALGLSSLAFALSSAEAQDDCRTQRRSSTWYLCLQYAACHYAPVHPLIPVPTDFEKPSAIQQRAILPIVKGRDVIAQAQSGTGKTATFSISVLQSIDIAVRETQALVLSPTRELATQIQSVVLALGDYMNVQCHACIGGTSLGEDMKKLDHGQHVVSGTPGRVYDMIRRRNLRTRNIKMLVLDEADELLNRGFKDQIYDVYRYLPPQTQVVLLSATLPYDVLEMTTKFMTESVQSIKV